MMEDMNFFRHQAEKDKTHPVPKESFTSEEQKENVRHFQKRTRNVRKSKKIKIGGERVSLDFPCHANQFGIRTGGWGRKKIPSSSVRSLSLKSSVCFFVRGPTGPRRRKWRKTG